MRLLCVFAAILALSVAREIGESQLNEDTERFEDLEAAASMELLKTAPEKVKKSVEVVQPSEKLEASASVYNHPLPKQSPPRPWDNYVPQNNYNNYIPYPQNNYFSSTPSIPTIPQNYNPTQGNYFPTNNFQNIQGNLPQSGNYIPNTSNYIPNTSNYIPNTSNYVPNTGNYIPNTSNYIPNTSNYIPNTSNYVPNTGNYIPNTSNYIPNTSNYIPNPGNFKPGNYVPGGLPPPGAQSDYYAPPQPTTTPNSVIKNEQTIGNDGSYKYEYQLADGTWVGEEGWVVNPNTEYASVVKKGWYSYVGADKKTYTVTYWAGDSGYYAYGDHLPTPPPVPPAIQAALDAEKNKPTTQAPQSGYYPTTQAPQTGYYPTTQAPQTGYYPTQATQPPYYQPTQAPQNTYYPQQPQQPGYGK